MNIQKQPEWLLLVDKQDNIYTFYDEQIINNKLLKLLLLFKRKNTDFFIFSLILLYNYIIGVLKKLAIEKEFPYDVREVSK